MVQQGSRLRLADRDQAQSIPAGCTLNPNTTMRFRQANTRLSNYINTRPVVLAFAIQPPLGHGQACLAEVTDAVKARDRVKTKRASIEHHVEHVVAEALAAGTTEAEILRTVGWSQQRLNGYITRHREDIEEMRATCTRLQAIFAGMQADPGSGT